MDNGPAAYGMSTESKGLIWSATGPLSAVRKPAFGTIPKKERFSKDQAKKTKKSERAIQRAAKLGSDLDEKTLKRIKGTSLDKGQELDALGLLPKASPWTSWQHQPR